jgi:hypothetical protein
MDRLNYIIKKYKNILYKKNIINYIDDYHIKALKYKNNNTEEIYKYKIEYTILFKYLMPLYYYKTRYNISEMDDLFIIYIYSSIIYGKKKQIHKINYHSIDYIMNLYLYCILYDNHYYTIDKIDNFIKDIIMIIYEYKWYNINDFLNNLINLLLNIKINIAPVLYINDLFYLFFINNLLNISFIYRNDIINDKYDNFNKTTIIDLLEPTKLYKYCKKYKVWISHRIIWLKLIIL